MKLHGGWLVLAVKRPGSGHHTPNRAAPHSQPRHSKVLIVLKNDIWVNFIGFEYQTTPRAPRQTAAAASVATESLVAARERGSQGAISVATARERFQSRPAGSLLAASRPPPASHALSEESGLAATSDHARHRQTKHNSLEQSERERDGGGGEGGWGAEMVRASDRERQMAKTRGRETVRGREGGREMLIEREKERARESERETASEKEILRRKAARARQRACV